MSREWMKRTAEGCEGMHPITAQHFRVIHDADDDRMAVWLDGRFLRTFPNDEECSWVHFINDLTASELDRQDEAEEQKTWAERAADTATAINSLWLYRMNRPHTHGRTTASLIVPLLTMYERPRDAPSNETTAFVRLVLPLVKDEVAARVIREWLAGRDAKYSGDPA